MGSSRRIVEYLSSVGDIVVEQRKKMREGASHGLNIDFLYESHGGVNHPQRHRYLLTGGSQRERLTWAVGRSLST